MPDTVRAPVRVRPATMSDAAPAVDTLVRAFEDDPPLNWFIRKDHKRREAFAEFFDITFRKMTLPFGAVEIADDGAGVAAVALWAPPGKWKVGMLEELRFLPSFVRVLGLRRFPRVLPSVRVTQAKHPHEPHYYLFAIAVDPRSQGRGIGSSLLKSTLDRCDDERMPAYLEASTEGSRRLYERWGFVLREELRVAEGAPPMWLMWREPSRG